MKRRRRLFSWGLALSSPLFAATVALWARSHLVADWVSWSNLRPAAAGESDGHTSFTVSSFHGTVGVRVTEVLARAPADGGRRRWQTTPADRVVRTRSTGDGSFGFFFSFERDATPASWSRGRVTRVWTARVPYWLPALPLGVAPGAWALARAAAVRGRRRAAAGRCAQCGYDLRASPGRCPECGAVFSDVAAPATSA